MAVRETSYRQARIVLSDSKLNFLLFFITALMAYMLTMVRTAYEGIVWYAVFISLLWVYISSVSQIEGRRNFLLSIHKYDMSKAIPPVIIWGVFGFIIFGILFRALGATVTLPSIPEIMPIFIHQIFVASAETIIFAVLLPEAIKSFLGIPGWVWGAGIYFSLYHIPAYLMTSPDLISLAFMGLVFYTLYKYGEVNHKVGGITAAISLHWVWNMWAILTASVIIFGL
jgi:membrane protease YdiL (CAAX protease family)